MQILKIFSSLAGIGALVISAMLVFAGAVALTVTNDDGYTNLPNVRFASTGVGLVAGDIDLSFDAGTDGITVLPTDIRLIGDLESSKDLFVAIGPDARVHDYLIESGFVRTGGQRGEIRLALEDGAPFTDPAAEDFWIATNVGDSIDWTVPAGDYSLVVLNRDGSAGLDVAFDGSARIPYVRPFGAALLGTGAAAAIAGLVLIYAGVRKQDPPASPEPSSAVAAT